MCEAIQRVDGVSLRVGSTQNNCVPPLVQFDIDMATSAWYHKDVRRTTCEDSRIPLPRLGRRCSRLLLSFLLLSGKESLRLVEEARLARVVGVTSILLLVDVASATAL